MFKLEQRVEHIEHHLLRMQEKSDTEKMCEKIGKRISEKPALYFPKVWCALEEMQGLRKQMNDSITATTSKLIEESLPNIENIEHTIRKLTSQIDHLSTIWNPNFFQRLTQNCTKVGDLSHAMDGLMLKFYDCASKEELLNL